MQRRIAVNLGNLTLALSDALDLASPSLAQHQQRTAFVVWELGKAASLPEDMQANTFMAALLHDIGALSLEEKIALHNSEVTNPDGHCIRGARLLAQVPWLNDASQIVRFHHKEWQDSEDTIDTRFVLEAQMLFLADCIERLIDRKKHILHQHEDIMSHMQSLSGSSYHPQVVDLFLKAAKREEFWLDLVAPGLYSRLLNEGPFRKVEIDIAQMSVIAELFRNIIDFRSRFTATHSSGVGAASARMSKMLGFTDEEASLMEVAGNLHDLGKLAIPNSILEKPGRLTGDEMAIMKSHTYYTYAVVKRIGGIDHIAEWAAYHHEQFDGSGYPFHCTAAELGTEARIMMVADMVTALGEERPYRGGMAKDAMVQMMKQWSERGRLDARVVNCLLENFNDIVDYVSHKQAIAKEFYEQQFASMEWRGVS